MNFSSLLVAGFISILGMVASRDRYGVRLTISNKSIDIPIDPDTDFESRCMFPYRIDSQMCLAYLNENENEIQFYDLNSGRLKRKIAVDDEDGTIGSIYGFLIVSPDSIYVSSSDSRIYLVDGNGNVLDRIDYTRVPIEGRAAGRADVGSARHIEMVKRGDKLIVFTGIRGDWLTVDQPYLDYQYLEMEIGLKDHSLKLLPMTYPKDYIARGLKPFEVSREYVDGTFIYSFAADHRLYVTRDHQSVTSIPARSDYIKSFPSLEKDMNWFSYRRYTEQNSFYGSLYYDQYRKVYYRFCDLGSNLMNIEGYRQHQSIIILDSGLRKIGETKLPDRTFNTTNCFIGPEGLYVSINTPYNSKMDRGKLSFALLELVEN